MKTIDDVTREEWGQFVEVMMDFLGLMRLMAWEQGADHDKDPSYQQAIERAVDAFRLIGLPQPSTAEYDARTREVLAMRPEAFLESLDMKKDGDQNR